VPGTVVDQNPFGGHSIERVRLSISRTCGRLAVKS
jgi:hypothetical protein